MITRAGSDFLLRAVQGGIRLYQLTLSPDHGLLKQAFPRGVCRYTPSCSQYMIEAISTHRWRGLLWGMGRLSRCHPFVAGGFDPVPPSKPSRPGGMV
jgi:uncharacterized protein